MWLASLSEAINRKSRRYGFRVQIVGKWRTAPREHYQLCNFDEVTLCSELVQCSLVHSYTWTISKMQSPLKGRVNNLLFPAVSCIETDNTCRKYRPWKLSWTLVSPRMELSGQERILSMCLPLKSEGLQIFFTISFEYSAETNTHRMNLLTSIAY